MRVTRPHQIGVKGRILHLLPQWRNNAVEKALLCTRRSPRRKGQLFILKELHEIKQSSVIRSAHLAPGSLFPLSLSSHSLFLMLPRQDSPPPPVDYANSDQLHFPSEASLTQISLLDDQSLNILAESPAFHPSTSVASFDQSDFNQVLLEQVKSPLPNDTLQPPLPRTNGLSSSLSDRESRLEYQFESMSLADGNVSGLFGTDEKQEPSSSKSFTQKNDEKEARSTTLTLKEQEKVRNYLQDSLNCLLKHKQQNKH